MGITWPYNMASSNNYQSKMLWKEIAATKNYVQLSVTLLLHKLWC